MSWSNTVLAERFHASDSDVETRRFGRTVARAVAPPHESAATGLEQTLAFLTASDADVVVLRYPADRVDWFAEMLSSGRTLIHADTLVYWRLRVGAGRRPSTPLADVHIHGPGRASSAEIDEFVSAVFAGYGSHYRANPLFDEEAVLAGYREWAGRTASEDLVTTLEDPSGIVGLATMTVELDHGEINLAGIRPDRQAQGLYAWLMAACEDLAASHAVPDLVISTQAQNLNVQRAWARFGLEPVAALATVHALRPGLLPDDRQASSRG